MGQAGDILPDDRKFGDVAKCLIADAAGTRSGGDLAVGETGPAPCAFDAPPASSNEAALAPKDAEPVKNEDDTPFAGENVLAPGCITCEWPTDDARGDFDSAAVVVDPEPSTLAHDVPLRPTDPL